MKKMYLVLLAFIGLVNIANAQAPSWQWAKQAGGIPDEDGNAVVTDASGNSYVTGSFHSSTISFGSVSVANTSGAYGASNVYVAKLDPNGNGIWVKGFGGNTAFNGNGTGTGIAIDGSGNLYITGLFTGTGMTFGSTTLTTNDTSAYSVGEIFITKLDGSGNVMWAKSAGGAVQEMPTGICVDASSNVFITGYFVSSVITFESTTLTSTNNSGLYADDVFIAKYNSSGSLQWAKIAGGSSLDLAKSISVDPSGNPIIAGYFGLGGATFGSTTLTSTAAANLFLVKYDGSSGNVTWAQTATATGSGSINHYAYGVSTDGSGNIYMTGTYASSTLTFGGTVTLTGGNIYVAKYDAAGTVVWVRSASGGLVSTDIVADAVGNTYTVGYYTGTTAIFGTDTITNFDSSGSNEDIFAAKYDASGTEQWAKSAGGTARDIANGVAVDLNGNAFVAGYFNSASSMFDAFTLVIPTPGYSDMFIGKLGAPVGINENEWNNSISAFPNPNNGLFFVKSEMTISQIEIVNILGEVIYSEKLNTTETQLDLSKQPKGIYFVKVISEDNKVAIKKIIVQ